MRTKALVYSGRLEAVEYPFVAVHDEILVKPLYIYLGDLERAVMQGYLPVNKPLVLGSMGVVKAVEVLEGPTEYTGKNCVVTPLGSKGVLGIEVDGLLSNYASIPSSYIDEEVAEPTPLDAIKPLIKHASELAANSTEPVIVEGCGLLGLATGLALRLLGVEPVFYCEEEGGRAQSYGFEVHRHTGNLSTRWSTLVVTSTSPSAKYALLKHLEYKQLVISPLSFTSWIPIRPGSTRVINPWKSENYTFIKRVAKELGRNIKVYSVQNVEEVVGLLPPRGLGVIISFKN